MGQINNGFLDEIKRAKMFWKEKLTGVDDWTFLPGTDKNSLENVHANYQHYFSETLTEKMLEISKKNDMSLYALLLTGLKVLLYKFTGLKDITVSSPAYLKSEFNRFIPLRDIVNAQMTFKELLLEIGETLLDGYGNQYYPIEKVTGIIHKDKMAQILTKVLFALESIHDIKHVSDIAHSTENVLTIVCKSEKSRLSLYVIYNTAMLPEKDMMLLINGYEKILLLMVHNINERIADASIINNYDKEKVLYKFNSVGVKSPQLETIHELYEKQVARNPEKIAIKHNNLSITYMELNEKSNKLARILQRNGVKKNTPVAILIERSIDLMIAILAVLKAGGAYLLLDSEYPELRVKYMIEDSTASIMLTRGTLNSRYEFSGEVIDINNMEQLDENNKNFKNINDSNDLACIVYSTGSEGNFNGVMIEHKGISNLINFCRNQLKISGEDKIALFSNIYFADFQWEIFMSLLTGAELHILSDESLYESTKFEQFTKDNEITVITVPPLYLSNLVPEKMPSLKKLIISGLSANSDISKRWGNKALCFNVYGMSETTAYASFCCLSDKKSGPGAKVIGKPIDNYRFYIIDKDGQMQPIGVLGELCISGIGIARGYFDKIELTKEKFIDSPYEPGMRMYKTGAIARWLPDGNVELIGRLDRQLEIRGYPVQPEEIEREIQKHEFVHNAIVINYKDKNSNSILTAYYVSDVEIQTSVLIRFLKNTLPYYMIPAYFVRVDIIPRNENGRVDVNLLPMPPNEVYNEEEYCKPRNKIEEDISDIWKKVLKLEHVSLKRSFLDMGGNSILVLKMVAKLSKVYPDMVNVQDIFSYPTIEQLALHITQKIKKTKDRTDSKFRDISNMSLKMPNNVIKSESAKSIAGRSLSYTFTKSLFEEGLQILAIQGIDELYIIIAAYIYTLSVISGEKKFIIHLIVDEGRVYPVSVDFNIIKDMKMLMQHINQTLKDLDTCDTYEIKDVNRINLKNNISSVIPLFYNVSSCVSLRELLEIYDIVLGAQSVEGDISVIFRCDESRIYSDKANQIFSFLINCIEEIVNELHFQV